MARPLRIEHEGALWHVTSRGNERKSIFRDDHDRERFLALLGEAVVKYGWILIDYMLLGNHFHLTILTPETTLSRGMQWLNSQYVRWFNRRHRRVGHLFQGRFDGTLVDSDSYFLRLCRYVVRNPVRAGMVGHPKDWKWSSFAAKAGLVPAPPWLDTDITLNRFHSTDRKEAQRLYCEWVTALDAGNDRPFDEVKNRIYLGSEEWMETIQALIDEEPRSPEHPKVQRHVRRPTMDQVVTAVAETFDIAPADLRCRGGGAPRMLAAWLGVYDGVHFHRSIASALGVGCSRSSALVQQCKRELARDPLLRDFAQRAREKLANRPPPVPYVLRRPMRDLERDDAPF